MDKFSITTDLPGGGSFKIAIEGQPELVKALKERIEPVFHEECSKFNVERVAGRPKRPCAGCPD